MPDCNIRLIYTYHIADQIMSPTITQTYAHIIIKYSKINVQKQMLIKTNYQTPEADGVNIK
jgi:dTDP-4-dehydrorhamnose reductase